MLQVFTVRGVDQSGRRVERRVMAANPSEAIMKAEKDGLTLVSIEQTEDQIRQEAPKSDPPPDSN